MTLLTPGALWLLALVLVVFFVRRRRARRQLAVANLYLWREPSRPDRMQFALARIRRHRLALLQAAFIVAVVIALARPVVSWQPRRVVFIVDVSASMAARENGSTRLQQALERAREVLHGLPARARVRIVAAGPSPVDLGERAVVDPALEGRLASLEVTAGAAALAAALRSVRAPSGAVPETYVFSDLLPPQPRRGDGAAGQVHWVTVGRPAQNAAITALSARRLTATHADGQVFVEVWNHGADARQTELQLTQDEVEIARLPLALAPDAAASLVVDVPRLDGVIRARLRHDDALTLDDERFTVAPSGAPIRVLLATAEGYFLEKALAANPHVRLEVAGRSPSSPSPASPYDVIVCDSCPVASEAGPGMLIVVRGASGRGPAAPLSLGVTAHPLLRALEVGDGHVAPLAVTAVPADADVILRVGDAPAVVAYERLGQRVVELRVDLASSELPLLTAFPVLVANAIDWLASPDAAGTQVRAGQPLAWTVRDSRQLAGVAVVGPDGRAVPAVVAARNLTVTGTGASGIYRVRGTGWRAVFAVAPDTESESDLTRRASAALDPDAPAPALRPAATPLSTALVVAALACLVAEWWARSRWAPGT